jgi:WhiB family transcriptional regulator, redox-sensing transcriptional regulator
VLQTIDRPTSHRRPGLPPTGGSTLIGVPAGVPAGSAPRRPRPVAAPAPVRRPLPCRVENPDLWFAESPDQLELAKSFCADCPVRDACLAGALDRAEPWGVWGGEIFERGAVIARKRPRGRPRKVAAA